MACERFRGEFVDCKRSGANWWTETALEADLWTESALKPNLWNESALEADLWTESALELICGLRAL